MITRLPEVRLKSSRFTDHVRWSVPSTKPWIVRKFSRTELNGSFRKEYLRARNPRRLHVDPMIAGTREYWIYRGDIFECQTRGLSSTSFLQQLEALGLTQAR